MSTNDKAAHCTYPQCLGYDPDETGCCRAPFTSEMAEAAERYLRSVGPHAHPLPAQFRWYECYRAMQDASPIAASPSPAQPEQGGAREVVATEVRADGKTVRVDRWEVGIRRIVALLWGNRREFEVDEVVEAVRALVPCPVNEGDDEGLVRAVLASAPPAAPPVAPAAAGVELTRAQINDLMSDAGWQNSAIRQVDLPKVERVVRAALAAASAQPAREAVEIPQDQLAAIWNRRGKAPNAVGFLREFERAVWERNNLAPPSAEGKNG